MTAADRAWTRRIDFLARTAAQRARPAIMGFRHMLMICMIVLFGFFSAASADLWAQWCVFSRARTRGFRRRAPRRRIVAAIFVGIMLLVDLMFLNESARARRRRVPTPGGPARPTPGTRAGIHLRPGPGQLAPARREKRLAAKLPALPPPPDFSRRAVTSFLRPPSSESLASYRSSRGRRARRARCPGLGTRPRRSPPSPGGARGRSPDAGRPAPAPAPSG